MNEQIIQSFVNENTEISLLIAFFLALLTNHYFSGKALVIAKRKALFAEVNHRSAHDAPVPAFGGISLFVVFLATTLTILWLGYLPSLGFIVLAAFFLFLSGLKDDLMGTSWRTKLLVQTGAAALVLINTDFSLTHLSGFLNLGEITPLMGGIITLIFIVFIINAFNLIDGIDGLAGLVAIISLGVFGVYYYTNDLIPYLLISTAMIGGLTSFLWFNFHSGNRKMFMGDTGSLLLGYILGINALVVLNQQPIHPEPLFVPQNAVIFILVILIIPVLDALRAIILRLSKGKKPWVADRNHIHHVLIDCGLSHRKATLCLAGLQVFAIVGVVWVNPLGGVALHFYLLCLYLSIAVLFWYLKVKKGSRNEPH